ncbi:MAG TPA: LysE family transporter, partial [Ottowia sp.]|nr:LysE family transporter [Ottowia sp.]
GAGLASALWFAALGYGARLLTPLFARPAAWRVLDSGVAVLMFTIAWGLLRGLRM